MTKKNSAKGRNEKTEPVVQETIGKTETVSQDMPKAQPDEQAVFETAPEEAPSQETAEQKRLRIKDHLEYVKYCYEIEERREKRLITTSSLILTIISIFFAVMAMMFDKFFDGKLSFFTTGCSLLLAVASVIPSFPHGPPSSAVVQKKIKPHAEPVKDSQKLGSLRKNLKDLADVAYRRRLANEGLDFQYKGDEYWIIQLTEMARELRESNRDRSFWIMVSVMCIMCFLLSLVQDLANFSS